MRLLLAISFLWINCAFGSPEPATVTRLKYKVMKDDKEIGFINAVRTTQGDQVWYDIETKMTIRVLVSQQVHYTSKATFKADILQNSHSRSFLNDKLHNTCVTLLKDNHYLVKSDKDEYTIRRSITYSGVMLYFTEPVNILQVYSEMSGQDNSIRKTGTDHYILTNSKSRKQNQYWYKAGLLEKAMINHTLADLEILRVH